MSDQALLAISPIDGRYHEKTKGLQAYFSEYALIKYRVFIELEYFMALVHLPLPQLRDFDPKKAVELERIANQFDEKEALRVKAIERKTNHDVKAVEYYLKEKFDSIGLSQFKEFLHFGLTSQDINNTAVPLSLKHAMQQEYWPAFTKLLKELKLLAEQWKDIPMLAHTHGQPASPTRLGKEVQVFASRLEIQKKMVESVPFAAKFGGATGNFNAHFSTYPQTDWHEFGKVFVEKTLGLSRSYPTTQIEHYDMLAALFQGLIRINTILIDLSRDMWTYISMEYFRQKVNKDEVGSSAMPHKVNPIDFENAEGNLGLANALLSHLSEKLPVSRLQRDLTDSTVLRNAGVPLAHTLISMESIQKGLGKLLLNKSKLEEDLENNWMVVAEGIQNILRREGYPNPYEALKALTRGKAAVDQKVIHSFIDQLDINEEVKAEMKVLTPRNYLGK